MSALEVECRACGGLRPARASVCEHCARANPDRAQLAALAVHRPVPLAVPMRRPPPAADHWADGPNS